MPPNQVETQIIGLSDLHDTPQEKDTKSPKLSSYNQFFDNKFKEHIIHLEGIPNVRHKIKYVLNNRENFVVEEKGKDDQIAQRFKDEGDKALEENSFKRALLLYTEALRYTAHDRTNTSNIMLSSIYSMRSIVLMKMNKLFASIQDIDRALLFHPEKANNELNERKKACLNLIKPVLGLARQRSQQPPPSPKLYEGISKELSSTSSALCMKESEEKGRHIVAVKDIPIGKKHSNILHDL